MKNKKFPLSLLLNFSFFLLVFSQNDAWEMRLDSLRTTLQQGKFAEVMMDLDQLENTLTFANLPNQLSDVFTLKGTAFRYANQLDEAIVYHQKALKIRQQLPSEMQGKVANSYLNIGNCYLLKEKLSAAQIHLEKALSIKLTLFSDDDPELLGIYNSLGNLFQKTNQPADAFYYLDKTLQIAQKGELKEATNLIATHVSIANFWYDQQLPDSAIFHLNLALDLQKESEFMESRTALIYNILGNAYAQKKALKKAESSIQKAIAIYQKSDGFEENVAKTYLNMGSLFLQNGNPRKAITYLQNATAKAEKNTLLLAQINNNLGVAYRQIGEFQLARKNFSDAMNGYNKIENEQTVATEIGDLKSNFGQLFLAQGQVGAAKHYFGEAWQIYEAEKVSDKVRVNALLRLADVAIRSDDFVAASDYLNNAEDFIAREDVSLYFLWLFRWGNFWEQQKDWAKSRKFYGKANAVLSDVSFAEKNQTPYPFEKLSVLAALSQVYGRSNLTADWQKGLDFAEEAIEILQSLRGNFDEVQAEIDLQNTFYHLYNTAIELCFLMAENEPKYKHRAFNLAENYRGNLLKKIVQKANVQETAGVAKEFFLEEKQLQQALAFYQKRRYELTRTDFFDQKQVQQLDSLLLTVMEEKEVLKKEIAAQHPNYFKLLYDYPTTTIAEVQKELTADQSLLLFQWGTGKIWCFLINQDTFFTQAIGNVAEIEASIDTLSQLYPIKIPVQTSQRKKEIIQQFVHHSHSLYQQLIAPIKKNLKADLTILPDGSLYYLPFELLIEKPAEKDRYFRTHEYFLNDHAIHYQYAANFSLPSQQITSANKNILSIAPIFQDSALILYHNEMEANRIHELLGGDLWTQGRDSKERFKACVQDYEVLHLSTHGFTNDRFSEYSFLAFSNMDTLGNAAQLFVSEIYNLPLDNTKMVVLSACQTANGKSAHGEGLLSLAHAFSFAGAKSLVASLWNVDDTQTPDLMHRYYQYLQAGDVKSIAMQKAKKEYLQSASEDAAYPFYWAGFLVIGDNSPIDEVFNQSIFWRYSGVWVILIGIFGWVVYHRLANFNPKHKKKSHLMSAPN